jgi:hypothetical protein
VESRETTWLFVIPLVWQVQEEMTTVSGILETDCAREIFAQFLVCFLVRIGTDDHIGIITVHVMTTIPQVELKDQEIKFSTQNL